MVSKIQVQVLKLKCKKMKNLIAIFIITSLAFSSCENSEWSFSDYDYQSVYFAYQYPVRTITLGEDIFDTSLDNAYQCKIMATTGGVYANNNDIVIDVVVDNSLCDGLVFEGTSTDIMPMPENYYSLEANQIVINKGNMAGGVVVQLTDAFFADPMALKNNYVIPVYMSKVENADTILAGKTDLSDPNRCVSDDWEVTPKDYVLYAVKYINQWQGNYLRHGKDEITSDGEKSTKIRHKTYVEEDEIIHLNTLTLSQIELPLDYQNKLGQDLNMTAQLSFDANQKCTLAPTETEYQLNDTIRVYNITTSGSGEFVKDGEKESWGNVDRDALYLNYQVGYEVEISYVTEGLIDVQKVTVQTTDTLVVRDRGVDMETFIPVLK